MKRRLKRKLLAGILAAVMVFSGVVCAPEMISEAKSVPKITMSSTENGMYSGYHATPDRTFLYKDGAYLHVVSVIGMKLTDYTLNKKYKIVSTL